MTRSIRQRGGFGLALVAWLFLAWSCNQVATSGGGGTDVPDSFQARVLKQDGVPATGARVKIRPREWTVLSGTPSPLWETRVDSSGRFNLVLPDTGLWSLEIIDSIGLQGRFLSFSPDSIRKTAPGAIHLAGQAALQGFPQNGSDTVPTLVILRGTDRSAVPDASGAWSFTGLAPGTYRIGLVYTSSPYTVVPSAIVDLSASDTIALGAAPLQAGAVAGRILSMVGKSSSSSVEGWIVVDQLSGASDTTDGSGSFSLPGLRGGHIHVVATDPVSKLSVAWDTATTLDSATALLPVRASDGSTAAWKEIRVSTPDGIRRRSRVRVLPDSSGLHALANIAVTDTTLAINGWTDDSGRFGLALDPSSSMHVTVVEPVSGVGAVFPWGGLQAGIAPVSIALNQPVRAGITVRYPTGSDNNWKGGHSVSLLGAGIAQSQTTTERIALPNLYPGKYSLALVRYQDGDFAPGHIEFSVTPGLPFELDTTVAQSVLEDTANWEHLIEIQIDPGSLSETLHGVAVQVVLDNVLDWDGMPASSTDYDHRYYDETGRWMSSYTGSWSQTNRHARVWIQLDSLAPGKPRTVYLRYQYDNSRPHIYFYGGGSIKGTKFVFNSKAGMLASYSSNLTDGTSNNASPMIAGGTTYENGSSEYFAWGLASNSSLTATQPTSALGTAFGVQTALQLYAQSGDTGTLLSLTVPGASQAFASLKFSNGTPVLHTNSSGVETETPISSSRIPRDTWLVAQFRRIGDSLAVDLRDPNAETDQSIAIPMNWPSGNDSLSVVIGSLVAGVDGFEGKVQSVEFRDSSWTRAAADFSATVWADAPKNVKATSLK